MKLCLLTMRSEYQRIESANKNFIVRVFLECDNCEGDIYPKNNTSYDLDDQITGIQTQFVKRQTTAEAITIIQSSQLSKQYLSSV